MDTSVSIGTGLASTRCCQPAASSRLASTCRNPVSESSTARRMGGWPVAMASSIAPGDDAVTRPARGVTGWSQVRRAGPQSPGGVRELAEQPGHDEGDLLADVDRV